MAQWACVVAALYVVALLALIGPVAWVAGGEFITPAQLVKSYRDDPEAWRWFSLWLGVMAVSQVALLAVPVRVASRRPMTRGAVWPTILAGGFATGLLVLGAVLSLTEFLTHDADLDSATARRTLGLAGLTWGFWALVFYRLSRQLEPKDFVARHCRWLLRGSILELLIAVPTHMVVRHRNYCCAGTMTAIGLALGVAVMLFAYGPAVYFLFVDRWRRLHPASSNQPAPAA